MRGKFLFQIALVLVFLLQIYTAKNTIGPLCLSNYDQKKAISCDRPGESIFVIQERYTNDVDGKCGAKLMNGTDECSGYLQNLKTTCNGKKECEITVKHTSFEFGHNGADCNFESEILFVVYECIPVNFDDKSIPKYDICSSVSIENPVHGFLHSPNYPNSYASNIYCQTSMDINAEFQRLEVYLIRLETEGLSKRRWKPTDSLLVNNQYFYGTKEYRVIYNETDNVVFLFQSDTWFNYQGFYLYFKVTTNKMVNKNESKKPVVLSTTTITTERNMTNESTIANQTHINTKSQTESTSNPSIQLLQRGVKLESLEQTSDLFNNSISNQTFVTLMFVIGLMSIAIMFLLYVNRRKFLRKNQPKGVPEGIYIPGDLQMINGNTSFVNPLIQQYGYKLNILNSAQPRTSNDSMAHLLSLNNGSISSSFVGANFIPINPKTNEPYEDISYKNFHGSRHYLNAIVKNMSESEHCDTKAVTNNLLKSSAAKLNEYCYIPASILQGRPSLYHNQPIIAEALRDNYEISAQKFSTSTPSLPKTLPPSMNDSSLIYSFDLTSDSDGNSYDTLTKKSDVNNLNKEPFEKISAVDNENETKTATLTETISESVTVTDDKEAPVIDEYQVPSNIPATD